MRKAIQANSARVSLVGLLGGAALILTGCNGTEDSNHVAGESITATVTIPVGNSPAAIASESADNYDDNNYGLVTGNTLASWITDWPANRPAGISGKLVILQNSVGETGYEYIAPNGVNVKTYLFGSSEFRENRSNGVMVTKSMVPSGQMMDNILSKYDINPTEDMIVCAQGKAGGGQSMGAGRCWYTFRYWGVPAGRLAVLNGGNEWIATNTALNATYFSGTGSTPPMTGFASVKDLPQMNFALQATLEDMIKVTPTTDTNVLDDGVFVWDARSTKQYSPTSDADYQSGPVQGHPNGALVLEYINLLDTANGYTYKSKTELQNYLTGTTAGFADATLQPLGAGSVYQDGDTIITYCETTYRAMVTGFATAAILGLPTRFYDGAMTEWHAMSNVVDNEGNTFLPIDSPWRTDTLTRSVFRQRDDLTHANNSPVTIVDAYGITANSVIIEDFAYKGIETEIDYGDTADSGTSDGGAPIAQGCG